MDAVRQNNYLLGFRDQVTSHVVPMVAHPVSSDPVLRRRQDGMSRLTNVRDFYYIIEVELGKQKIPLHLDTGSSDTWMVQDPFECVTIPGMGTRTIPNCGFTTGFQGPPSGGVVPDLEFARAYGDGTFATGFFGVEDVTIGGLVARNQRIGFVNYTLWNGDGRSAGLMGLGYPYLTSLDIGGEEIKAQLYDPVFTTLWRSKAIPPVFSVALSRFGDQSAGRPKDAVNTKGVESFLALGGLPPVAIDEGSWGRTPLLPMEVLKRWGFGGQKERGFYAIAADAYVFGNRKGGVGTASEEGLSRNTSQFPVVIDVGSTDTILPNVLIKQLYAAFDPPAEYRSHQGRFWAKCGAKVPEFGITLGGKTFLFAPEDLLRQSERDPTGEWCRIGVYDGYDSDMPILGVSFLSNVLAVFDVEKHEMRFAQRTKY
ncbi:aspartic protease PEP3 [Podospora conica]|nr:aspartic protease PEP3 [Schizothecium conicum]